MDSFNAYSYATSAWLTTQALPLLFTPKLVISLLTPTQRATTEVETYLARSLGLVFFLLAGLTLVLTGALPLSTSASAEEKGAEEQAAYAAPTLVLTTAYHGLTAFYIYAQTAELDRGCFALYAGLAGSGGVFALGVWALLFGGEKARLSKSTGADKRTSGFPFENRESAREKKREEKEKSKDGKRRTFLRSGK